MTDTRQYSCLCSVIEVPIYKSIKCGCEDVSKGWFWYFRVVQGGTPIWLAWNQGVRLEPDNPTEKSYSSNSHFIIKTWGHSLFPFNYYRPTLILFESTWLIYIFFFSIGTCWRALGMSLFLCCVGWFVHCRGAFFVFRQKSVPSGPGQVVRHWWRVRRLCTEVGDLGTQCHRRRENGGWAPGTQGRR